MWRLPSTTRWYELPGVVGAYQAIGAPNLGMSYCNCARGFENQYELKPRSSTATGSLSGSGWVLAGTGWLNTNISPNSWGWTYILSFSFTTSDNNYPCGQTRGSTYVGLVPQFGALGGRTYLNGNYTTPGASLTGAHIMCVAGLQPYLDGAPDGSAMSLASFSSVYPIMIGARGAAVDTGDQLWTGSVASFVIYSRTLTASEVFLACNQMKFCNVNPDWNAWTPKRSWWFAGASAAAGMVGVYGRRRAIALPGGVSIREVNP